MSDVGIISLIAGIIYTLIFLFHFTYFYPESKRYRQDRGDILFFFFIISFFWPFTWIWYGIDHLRRGRVA